jgi:WD40 repeat protein
MRWCAPARGLAQLEGGRFELAISHDGSALAWAHANGELRLIGADGGSVTLGRLPREGTSVDFSPDGRWLAAGASDGSVVVVELATRELRWLAGHAAPVQSTHFSPDGRWLATAATEPGVQLWELGTGNVRRLESDDTILYGLAFSRDGAMLATTGSQAAIVVTTRLQGADDGARLIPTGASSSRPTVAPSSARIRSGAWSASISRPAPSPPLLPKAPMPACRPTASSSRWPTTTASSMS